MSDKPSGEIVLYQRSGGAAIDVRLDGETAWLSLNQLATLLGRDKSTISRHIANVFGEGELQRASVVAEVATTAADGKTYRVEHFNLDVIISVGSPDVINLRCLTTALPTFTTIACQDRFAGLLCESTPR